MKVICRHGYFSFYPQNSADKIRFERISRMEIVAVRDYFTFKALENLPSYSLFSQPFGGIPALKSFAGRHPADVMKENGFVFSLAASILVPFTAMAFITTNITQTENAAVYLRPLMQPGSTLKNGRVLLGYEGFIDLRYQTLRIFSQELL